MEDKDTEKEGKKKELMWTEVQLAHKKSQWPYCSLGLHTHVIAIL